tara:strand:- start:76 stop:471 length:396 start_codon:yes stop_codon:yes gene_type:complete
MKSHLIKNESIEIRDTKSHGYGVFAKNEIKKGEMLEECRLIFIPYGHGVEPLTRYLYPWDPDDPMRYYALPIGYGSLYNSSGDDPPSVDIEVDEKNQIIQYIANKDIKRNDELMMRYAYNHDDSYIISVEN